MILNNHRRLWHRLQSLAVSSAQQKIAWCISAGLLQHCWFEVEIQLPRCLLERTSELSAFEYQRRYSNQPSKRSHLEGFDLDQILFLHRILMAELLLTLFASFSCL